MNILVTVCGRAGSKGVKNKNMNPFYGYPLVLYTLSAIDLLRQQSEHHIDIVMNTDSAELIESSNAIQGCIIINRDESLAGDQVSKFNVIKDSYVQVSKTTNVQYDMIVDLDITSPIRTIRDIQNVIESKEMHPQLDVVFTVVPSRRSPYFNMVEEKDGVVGLVKQSRYTARQQAPQSFDMNASIYSFSPQFLENSDYLFDGNCGMVEMKDTLVLDIDSVEDFDWMEYIYKKLLAENEEYQLIYNHITQILK